MVITLAFLIFFFFKQKTAYEITRRDWSSDVCSSDLDPSFFKSPQHLRIHSPIVKRFRDRKRFIRAPAGLEPAIHDFRLPFHKRKTPFSMGAFPLVKEISAVNLGSRICAGLVGAKRARNASQHHLSWTKVDRIFPARDPDEILQAARLTIGRYAVEKHSVVTRIPKRKSRAAAPILRRKNQLRIPR